MAGCFANGDCYPCPRTNLLPISPTAHTTTAHTVSSPRRTKKFAAATACRSVEAATMVPQRIGARLKVAGQLREFGQGGCRPMLAQRF